MVTNAVCRSALTVGARGSYGLLAAMTCGPSDSSWTACVTARLVAGAVRSSSECRITLEEYNVSCGNLAWIASEAACDSEPGRLKVSSYSPPCEELSMNIAPAMNIQTLMTRHGWRPAKLPIR